MSRFSLLLLVIWNALHAFVGRGVDPKDANYNSLLRDPLRRCVDKQRGAVVGYEEVKERPDECIYACLSHSIWYFGFYTKGTSCKGGKCELGLCLSDNGSILRNTSGQEDKAEGAKPNEPSVEDDSGSTRQAPTSPPEMKKAPSATETTGTTSTPENIEEPTTPEKMEAASTSASKEKSLGTDDDQEQWERMKTKMTTIIA